MQRSHVDEMQELLSCYIDGQLAESEHAQLEAHLAGCNDCQNELADLRSVVAFLRQLPVAPVPRSFVLPVTPRRSPIVIALPWMQRLTALAAALLLLIASVDAFGGFTPATSPVFAPLDQNVQKMAAPAGEGAAREFAAAPMAPPAPASTSAQAHGDAASVLPTAAAAAAAPAATTAPAIGAAASESTTGQKLPEASSAPTGPETGPSTGIATTSQAVTPGPTESVGNSQVPANKPIQTPPINAVRSAPNAADEGEAVTGAPLTVRLAEGILALTLIGAGSLSLLGRRALKRSRADERR